MKSARARWWMACAYLSAAAAGVVVTLLVIDLATPHAALTDASISHLGRVIGTFLVSPGFGGAAAVLAAALAYRAAAKTRANAKAQAEADRNNALDDREDDRWWSMYRLVYEDAPGMGEKGATLALEALEEKAHTGEQDSFLVVLSERLQPTDAVVEEETS